MCINPCKIFLCTYIIYPYYYDDIILTYIGGVNGKTQKEGENRQTVREKTGSETRGG